MADNGGVPVAGSYSLQPIEVCEASVGTVVVGGVTEEDVPTGRMLIVLLDLADPSPTGRW